MTPSDESESATEDRAGARIIVVRAWREDRADSPFRAVVTTQIGDDLPERHVAGSIDEICEAVKGALADFELR